MVRELVRRILALDDQGWGKLESASRGFEPAGMVGISADMVDLFRVVSFKRHDDEVVEALWALLD